jgi:hypothetical protein
MSPTEFSNYIKQRQQMQQHNNHYHHQSNHHQGGMSFGPIGSISPARSISPNPMTLQMTNDSSMHQNPFVFPSNGFNGLNMYQSFGSPRNMFENIMNGGNNGGNYNQFNGNNDPLLFTPGKCSSFMDQQSNFCKIPSPQQQQQQQHQQQAQQQNTQSILPHSPQASTNNLANGVNANNVNGTSSTSGNANQQSDSSKLLDGMNSFYNNNSNSSYQHHLLVAN